MAGERTEQQEVTALLAGRLRDAGDSGQVTVSGRCRDCGYLLTSPSHAIACGARGDAR